MRLAVWCTNAGRWVQRSWIHGWVIWCTEDGMWLTDGGSGPAMAEVLTNSGR